MTAHTDYDAPVPLPTPGSWFRKRLTSADRELNSGLGSGGAGLPDDRELLGPGPQKSDDARSPGRDAANG